MTLETHPLTLDQLRSALHGTVIAPGDADYDSARSTFYGGIDRRPAFIARPADAQDVATLVRLARDSGLPVAVRSGGHSSAGHSVVEGGLVIDLCAMKKIEIDAEARTAWVETGMTAGEYTVETAKHGLGTGFGDTGSVGVGGITLGGGVGYLVRKHGLTIDALLAAEIVTAEGQILRVDEQQHPDLFWAIRGGGGNFGVVTRFQFRLYPLDQVYGGMLFLPATPETLLGFIHAAEVAPEDLSTIVNVMAAPPMPFIPEELHGQLILMAMMVYAGDPAEGENAVAPFRALATPLADMLRPMAYPEMYPPEEGGYHPVAYGRTFFFDHFGPAEAAATFEHLARGSAMMSVAHFRVLGGAMARVPNEATAFAHRQRLLMGNIAALEATPETLAPHIPWVDAFAAAFAQGEPGAYVNFLGDEGEERIRQAYPGATWDRLRRVKATYDPQNLFRQNHNIPPAG